MDSIIGHQTIAHRRRPYAPIIRQPKRRPSFIEGLGSSEKRNLIKNASPLLSFECPGQSHIWTQERHKRSVSPLSRRGREAKLAHADGATRFSTFLAGCRLGLQGSIKRAQTEFANLNNLKKLPRRASIASGSLLILAIALLSFFLAVRPRTSLPSSFLLPTYEGKDEPSADLLLAYISPELAGPADDSDVSALPLPTSLEYSSYTVRAGDSLASIAKRFNRRVDSIVNVNGIKSAKSLKTGTVLKIPNMDGLIHIVAKGESLGMIASRSKVDMTLIADANDLGSATLSVGQSLFIPGARLQAEELKRIYGTNVLWPARGPISSYFGLRSDPFTGVRRFHTGIDIAVDLGTPVKAAIDGKVADLGYNANYGNYIILNHGDGLQTLYGHLSAFDVVRGQTVSAGAVIARSGNTGYSTGPHLHFGVYRKGAATNPLKLLK